MRIHIDDNAGTNIRLRLPGRLIVNRLSVLVVLAVLKKYGVVIPRQHAFRFVKALHDYKRHHPQWKLVEIHSSTGETVEVNF